MKLTTMIDQRVTCIVKNYKVDEKTKQMMFEDLERKAVMEIEAPPLDQQAPIYIALNKNGQKQMAQSDSSDDDDGVKKIAKHFGQHREPGSKKVSLTSGELRGMLFSLFNKRQTYKLNELSNILNHPVAPLKLVLNTIADFDNRKKLYALKP